MRSTFAPNRGYTNEYGGFEIVPHSATYQFDSASTGFIDWVSNVLK